MPPDPDSQAQDLSLARQRRRKLKQEVSNKQARKFLSKDVASGNDVATTTEQHLMDEVDSPQVDQNPGSDEVEDFFSLLNSTLFMPDEEAVSSVSLSSLQETPLPSGRLAERIRTLRVYVMSLHEASLIFLGLGSVKKVWEYLLCTR